MQDRRHAVAVEVGQPAPAELPLRARRDRLQRAGLAAPAARAGQRRSTTSSTSATRSTSWPGAMLARRHGIPFVLEANEVSGIAHRARRQSFPRLCRGSSASSSRAARPSTRSPRTSSRGSCARAFPTRASTWCRTPSTSRKVGRHARAIRRSPRGSASAGQDGARLRRLVRPLGPARLLSTSFVNCADPDILRCC